MGRSLTLTCRALEEPDTETQAAFSPPTFTKTRMYGEPWSDTACMSLWIAIHRVSGEDIFPGYRDRGCPGKVSRGAQAGLAGWSWLQGSKRAARGAPMLLTILPHPVASLPTFLAVEIPSICLGLPRAEGTYLPLQLCSCVQPTAAGAMGGAALCLTLPQACHPDPRGNSLPPTNSPSYLRTAAADKWASWDGNLRQLLGVEKHVKTCHDGLPARQMPVSPRFVRSLARHMDHSQQQRRCWCREGLCLGHGSLGLDGCWLSPHSHWSKAVPRAPTWPQAPGSGAHLKPELRLNITMAHGGAGGTALCVHGSSVPIGSPPSSRLWLCPLCGMKALIRSKRQ